MRVVHVRLIEDCGAVVGYVRGVLVGEWCVVVFDVVVVYYEYLELWFEVGLEVVLVVR